MKTLTALLCCLALLSCGRTASQRIPDNNFQSTTAPFAVNAQQKGPGSTILHISLKNTSGRPIAMLEHELPWRNRYSMTIVVTPQRTPNLPLRMFFAPDDAIPSTIVIRPQQVLEGDLDIADRFLDVRERLDKEKPLLLFWVYELRAVSRESLGRQFGGSVLR